MFRVFFSRMPKALQPDSVAGRIGDARGDRSRRPVVPAAMFALLLTAFLLAFGTILVLGLYAQPAKDDYLSAVMFRGMSVPGSLRYQYANHNGRLLSALLMRFSPLQYHSFSGYKLYCVAFAILFAVSMLRTCRFFLRGLLPQRDRLAVFFAAYLCLHLALGNLAEFYYWLPAISCYGVAALLFMAFIRVLPAALGAAAMPAFLTALVLAALLPLSCEPGAVLGLAAVAVMALWNAAQGKLSGGRAAGLAVALLAVFLLAALSPGNALRLATSPHSRSLVQTLAGSVYLMSGTVLRLVSALVPPTIFIWVLLRWRMAGLQPDGRFLLRAAALVVLFWFGGEILAFYGIGGVPALRVRNGFLVLVSLLLAAVLRLALGGSAGPRPSQSGAGQTVLWLCAGWIAATPLMTGSPIRGGLQDLVSGTAARYDADMRRIYSEAARRPVAGTVLKVSPVSVIPASLYVAQPLILKEELNGWPWLNVQMANYFGYQRLYADSLAATPGSEEAFQNWLRHRRSGT